MNSPARCVSVGFLLTAATLGIPEAWGANLTWQASSGDWSIASNWGGTLPTGIDAAYLMNGGTATVTQLGETCVTLSLGGNSAGSGTVLMTAGTGSLAMTGYEYIGDSGIGNFTQSGGTNSVTSYLYVGNATGSRGTYNLSGSGWLSASSEFIGNIGIGSFAQTGGTNSMSRSLYLAYSSTGSRGTYSLGGSGRLSADYDCIGYSGSGSFTQSGGTNAVSNFLFLGFNTGASGSYALNSGALSAASEYLGYAGTGSFTQSGGTNTASNDLYLGYNTGSNGSYRLSGSGLLSAKFEYVGTSGTGTFTQSDGTNSAGSIILGEVPGSMGTYNLNGGLLNLAGLSQGSGSATFNFSDGTLQTTLGFSTNVPIVLSTVGSDAVFEVSGSTLTLAGPLSGPGGLQETGTGLLILSGSNNYRGGTTVSGGTLEVLRSSSLADGTSLTVGSDAPLIFFSRAARSALLADNVNAVPEPSSLLLLAAGIVMLAGYGLRRRKGNQVAASQ